MLSLNLRIVHDCIKWAFMHVKFIQLNMTESAILQSILHDVTHFGVRITIGMIFVMHSPGKFDPGFAGFITKPGLPPEMQIPKPWQNLFQEYG